MKAIQGRMVIMDFSSKEMVLEAADQSRGVLRILSNI